MKLFTFALLLTLLIISMQGCSGAGPKTAQNGNASNWSYTEKQDKMGRGVIKAATTASSNTVAFNFPGNVPQQARLTLRNHPQEGGEVIFSVVKSQFLSTGYRKKVLVRFDDRPPIIFYADEPADNSTDTVFIDDYQKFCANLRHAKKVMIEAQFYQEGGRIFEFNVGGLDWDAFNISKP